MATRKTHVANAFRWSTSLECGWVDMASSALGMSGPIIAGAAAGHPTWGLAAAIGGLAIDGGGGAPRFIVQARALSLSFLPMVAAPLIMLLATPWAGRTDVLVVAFAVLAAVIGGCNRALMIATTRFVVFLVIITGVTATFSAPGPVLLLVMLGALWTSALSLCLGAFARLFRARSETPEWVPNRTAARPAFARWKRSLARLTGWQYALRLGLCLSLALIMEWRWPGHHLHWVALTVAILIQRRIEIVPVRTIQRTLGTTAGVVIAALLFANAIPVWASIGSIGLLAGLRPFLKARNYLAYAAVMTPLIILILDGGQPAATAVLTDRLTATLIGAGLVVSANWLAVYALGTASAQVRGAQALSDAE